MNNVINTLLEHLPTAAAESASALCLSSTIFQDVGQQHFMQVPFSQRGISTLSSHESLKLTEARASWHGPAVFLGLQAQNKALSFEALSCTMFLGGPFQP